METATTITLTKRSLKSIGNDSDKVAKAANLVHVSDTQPGIRRVRQANGFSFYLNNRKINSKNILSRINKLVIPPAWENVWICAVDNGHLQATGYDAKNRKQYIYHPAWNLLRNQTKYYHLYEFGKALSVTRERLQHDLARHGLPSEKILAAIVSVMQYTSIRIGSNAYEKLYGSFGLTTLKNKHVEIHGSKLRFCFVGKKGVHHDISLTSRKLSKILQQCKEIPGKELFQYYDEEGNRHPIDSGMVNNYIKEISGGNFTAKDFRTWTGTLHAIEALKELGEATSATDAKKKVNEALDMVAKQLGNTRSVCRKYYVHPAVLDHYTNHTLGKFWGRITKESELKDNEQILMKILADTNNTVLAA